MATTATNPVVAEPAPAAGGRGGLFGRRHHDDGVATTRGGRFSLNAGARIGLAISQLLTIIAFTIVLGGLSSLQHRANNLTLLPQQQALYIDSFQSGQQIPYPNNSRDQFGLQWWVLMFEIFIFLMIAVLLVMPRHLLRLKHTAMAFLVYVLTLTTLQVNSLLYFKRSPVAAALFGERRIKVTLAGAMFGCICNGLSIIFLGLLREDRHLVTGGVGGKRVGVEEPAIEPGTGAAAV